MKTTATIQFPSDINHDERRDTVREPILHKDFRGVLVQQPSQDPQPLVILDISSEGVGVWIPYSLEAGSTVVLNLTGDQKVDLEGKVMWCAIDRDRGGYRAGIKLDENSEHWELLAIATQSPS